MQSKSIVLVSIFFVHFATFGLDVLGQANQGNANAMYSIGNQLCALPVDWTKCKTGMQYLWSAHLKHHPNALNQYIYYGFRHFEELTADEQHKIYNLKDMMSVTQKIQMAEASATVYPKKAQTIFLEAANQNHIGAQLSYIKYSFTRENWEFNTKLIIKFLHSLQNHDDLSRLMLAELYAQGFLVKKNARRFRSLASSVWRKLLNQPEELERLVQKTKSIVHHGRQKYELNRKVNGSK